MDFSKLFSGTGKSKLLPKISTPDLIARMGERMRQRNRRVDKAVVGAIGSGLPKLRA